MSDIIAAFLATLSKSYDAPSTIEAHTVVETRSLSAKEVEAVKRAKVASKGRAIKAPKSAKPATGEQAAPIGQHAAPVINGLDLPKAGSINAVEYLIAFRAAGRRTSPLGKPIFDKGEERNDIIKAIAGFIGWDPHQSFATQEMAAKSKAVKATSPSLPATIAAKSPVVSLVAFAKGMPDHQAKAFQNLLARERLAVETMLDLDKQASLAITEQDKSHHQLLASLERNRLDEIRKEMAAYGEQTQE